MLLTSTLFWLTCFASQQPMMDQTKSPLDAAFDAQVDKTLAHFHVPGLSLSINHGEQTFSKGYGYADYEADEKATPDTLFGSASTTKAFTAAALSLLIDDQQSHPGLAWDTTISSLLSDDFVTQEDYRTKHITLEDALSHRTGLPGHDFAYGGPDKSVSEIVRRLRYLQYTTGFRTTFQYNNLFFTTVGYIIEQLAGRKLGNFMHDRIWEPLNMTSTYMGWQAAQDSGKPVAQGYSWNEQHQKQIPQPQVPLDQVSGAGAMLSTANDYAKWIRSMIRRQGPISARGHAALMQPRTIVDPESEGLITGHITGDVLYTLGWNRYVHRDQVVVQHEGAVNGFGTLALYLPDMDWGIAIFANTQWKGNDAAMVLAYHLIDNLLQVPQAERFDFVAAFDKKDRHDEKSLAEAYERLYPDVPAPPLFHKLPLRSYTGTYAHPAYGDIVIDQNRTEHTPTDRHHLHISADRDLLAYEIDLEHVSGESWLATLTGMYSRLVVYKVRAEFVVDDADKTNEFGIELESDVASKLGEKMWFKRKE